MRKIIVKGILSFFALILGLSETHAQPIEMYWATYEGRWSYYTIDTPAVTNPRQSGISGMLRFSLWATYFPYEGNPVPGYQVSEIDIGKLVHAHEFHFINTFRGIRDNVPAGYYHMTLILTEDTPSGAVVQDWYAMGQTYLEGYATKAHYPTISVTSPRRGKTVSAKQFTISGVARDDVRVQRIEVFLNSRLIRTISYPRRWSVDVKNARVGKNNIRLVVYDDGGLNTVRKFKVTAE